MHVHASENMWIILLVKKKKKKKSNVEVELM